MHRRFETISWYQSDYFQHDDSIDEEVNKSTYPRIIASGDLANLYPVYIAAEGQIYLNFSGKNIAVAMLVSMLIATFYVLNMEYTPGVSNIYSFLEAVLMGNRTDAKKRISLQKFVNELGLKLK